MLVCADGKRELELMVPPVMVLPGMLLNLQQSCADLLEKLILIAVV